MLFATDTRCSYANVVVRKELCDKGVKTVEALADAEARRPQGGGRGHRHRLRHHVYGVYVLQERQGAPTASR